MRCSSLFDVIVAMHEDIRHTHKLQIPQQSFNNTQKIMQSTNLQPIRNLKHRLLVSNLVHLAYSCHQLLGRGCFVVGFEAGMDAGLGVVGIDVGLRAVGFDVGLVGLRVVGFGVGLVGLRSGFDVGMGVIGLDIG